MKYQIMELEVPRLSHGRTEDERAIDVPGRIVSVLADHGGPDRYRTLSVLVELEPGLPAKEDGDT